MIPRTPLSVLLLRSRLRPAISGGARCSRPVAVPFRQFGISHRWRSESSSRKELRPQAFALPKAGPSPALDPQVPQQDIDDFRLTTLVHGSTDLQIAITQSASDKLHLIATLDQNPNTALKIVVESGGCHGFQYNLNLCDMKQELAGDEDGELLAFQRQDGLQGYVILNESSLEILQDSKVEYSHELIGSSFKVVDSPYTSTACGCGASFDFDFEKLQKKVQERSANK